MIPVTVEVSRNWGSDMTPVCVTVPAFVRRALVQPAQGIVRKMSKANALDDLVLFIYTYGCQT